MPTDTFFRLPEEKRTRILDAAWQEFTQRRFADASINRIIRQAGIPRGSFYQYFVDKEDIFGYLIGTLQKYFSQILHQLLEQAQGDLFAFPQCAFDWFVHYGSRSDLTMNRCIHIFQMNPGVDLQQMLALKECIRGSLIKHIEAGSLRRPDQTFAEQTAEMLVMTMVYALANVLAAPECWEEERRLLALRVEIIRYGSIRGETRA